MKERYADTWEDADFTPLSLAWALRRASEVGEWDDLAAFWASQAFKGAREDIVREVVQDVLMAPILSYPGRSVRPLCKACGGIDMIAYLLMDGVDVPLDPDDPSTWNFAPCPRCGGTGTEPEEDPGEDDPSWDWPPELYIGSLTEEFGLLDEDDGQNGPEAR